MLRYRFVVTVEEQGGLLHLFNLDDDDDAVDKNN